MDRKEIVSEAMSYLIGEVDPLSNKDTGEALTNIILLKEVVYNIIDKVVDISDRLTKQEYTNHTDDEIQDYEQSCRIEIEELLKGLALYNPIKEDTNSIQEKKEDTFTIEKWRDKMNELNIDYYNWELDLDESNEIHYTDSTSDYDIIKNVVKLATYLEENELGFIEFGGLPKKAKAFTVVSNTRNFKAVWKKIKDLKEL